MPKSNIDATSILEPANDLLPSFTTRQYSHLPTPQSPNTLGRYLNEPASPQTPVPHNNSQASSLTPASSDKQEPWIIPFDNKSMRLGSIASQYATPESSPQFHRHNTLPSGNKQYPFHATVFSTPKPFMSSLVETPIRASSPAESRLSHSPPLSSPFIGRMSAESPNHGSEFDDVFSAPKRHHDPNVTKSAPSTPPVSSTDIASASTVHQVGGELERIRRTEIEETRNRIQEAESRRPDYLKRTRRTLSDTNPSYFAEDPNMRERWPAIGVMDSPQKGRRLKLFQETSDESFEESLMAGGYGRYRTTDWVRQPQPISTNGGSSVVLSLLEKAEEVPATERELKKQKRLAAFCSVVQPGNSKVCPVELEGKGRVLMEVASVDPGIDKPEPNRSKRKPTRRKKQPANSSPDKKPVQTSSHEPQLEKPNWPDTEFPWRIRTEEHTEEVKAIEEERLRWIERYLDRDSDSDVSEDELPFQNGQQDSAIVDDRGVRTPYQVKMGRGKMIPLSVVRDDPWNLIPKRPFPLDSADAREALLSKKTVRTLSYRQQKRKRQEFDDDDEDEVLCICNGKDDGRQLVQCDACRMWYHLQCLGIKSVAVLGREEDPWFCGRCHARSLSPSSDLDGEPSSEPTFVPTDPLPISRRSSDTTFFQPTAPESPHWSSTRLPKTPTRNTRNSDSFRPSWNWNDLSRPIPTTPRQIHPVTKIYSTPESNSNIYDSPFDPASTPSRGIKFHVPFATPKTNTWRPNSILQTPSKVRGGSNRYHMPHFVSLDDNLSTGSGFQYSVARVLPSDESPIRRNRSFDATYGRRRFLSPVRTLPER